MWQFDDNSTAWSVILSAQSGSAEERREALEQLIGAYWQPVYLYLRHWGKPHHDAIDLTQQFFTELLEGDAIDKLSRERGRFRGFLKVALQNFLRKDHRDQSRQKRGGGRAVLSLDVLAGADELPVAPGTSPEEALDREWQRLQLGRAIEALRETLSAAGKPVQFAVFAAYYLGGAPARPTHAELASAHEVTPTQVNNYLAGARRQLRGLLSGIVAASVSDAAGLQTELTELFGDSPIP